MKLGIIGNGFVGSAVAHGFEIDTEQFIVDPKFNEYTLQDLVNWDAESHLYVYRLHSKTVT